MALNGNTLTRGSIYLVSLISMAGLFYIYAFPPKILSMTCENVSHFAPAVKNPETGEELSIHVLARHYRLGLGG